jgi:threonine synthase
MCDPRSDARLQTTSAAQPSRFVPQTGGIWRFMERLPLDAGPIHFPLHVGDTPLLAPGMLRAAADMPALWLKDETSGPSGSCKDRATALLLEDGARRGRDTVTTASTGNAAVSTCVGAAAMGMRAVVFVPAACDSGKLEKMEACGADVFTVDGYAAGAALSGQLARRFDWIDRNDANPVTLEAIKTVSFEIWEQLGARVPDVVVVSVGDGTMLSGIARGFRELRERHASLRLPRLIGIQAAVCRPLVCRWRGEEPAAEDLNPHATAAEGLAVVEPCEVDRTLADVSATSGELLSVTEAQIAQAAVLLATKSGLLVDPAAAAAFAGVRVARATGIIRRSDETVVVITGRSTTAPAGGHGQRQALAPPTIEGFERAIAARAP